MNITPLDIRRKEFRRSVRGYLDEDVDVFLDAVADELERWSQENRNLEDRVQALEQQVAGHAHIREALEKTLVAAQIQSEEIRSNAEKEKESILRDAESKAKTIVADLYTQTQKVQQTLMQLKLLEEDFRFKFRGLLEGYLKLLEENPVLLSGLQPGATDPSAPETKDGIEASRDGESGSSPPSSAEVAADDSPTLETEEPAAFAEAAEKASAAAESEAREAVAQEVKEKVATDQGGPAVGAKVGGDAADREGKPAPPAMEDTAEDLTVETGAPPVAEDRDKRVRTGKPKKDGRSQGVFFGRLADDPDDPFPGSDVKPGRARDFEW